MYEATVTALPNVALAPPRFYLLFLVQARIPGHGKWVKVTTKLEAVFKEPYMFVETIFELEPMCSDEAMFTTELVSDEAMKYYTEAMCTIELVFDEAMMYYTKAMCTTELISNVLTTMAHAVCKFFYEFIYSNTLYKKNLLLLKKIVKNIMNLFIIIHYTKKFSKFLSVIRYI